MNLRSCIRDVVTVIALFTLTELTLNPTIARASEPALQDFRKYGFHSRAEMAAYFTVVSVDVKVANQESRKDFFADPVVVDIPGLGGPPTGVGAPANIPGGGYVPDDGDLPGGTVGGIPKSGGGITGLPGSGVGGIGGSGIGGAGGFLPDWTNVQTWVVIGEKIWNFVVANKPVANVTTQRIAVIPSAATNWMNMENWQGPKLKVYTFNAKNIYGVTVMSQKYAVSTNYDGQYKGAGHFLSNATIIPAHVDVVWGYKANSKVTAGTPINAGRANNPIAAIELELDWALDSVVQHQEGRETYFIKGTGEIMQTSTGLK